MLQYNIQLVLRACLAEEILSRAGVCVVDVKVIGLHGCCIGWEAQWECGRKVVKDKITVSSLSEQKSEQKPEQNYD